MALFAVVTGAQQREHLVVVGGSFLRTFLAKGFSTVITGTCSVPEVLPGALCASHSQQAGQVGIAIAILHMRKLRVHEVD